MKKRTSSMSRRIVSLLMSMVLTLTLVTPAAFATEVVGGSGTAIVEGNTNLADPAPGEDSENNEDKNTEHGGDEQPTNPGDEDKNPGEGEGDDANKPDEDKKDEAPDGENKDEENKDEQPTEDENNGEDDISLLNDENGTDVWVGNIAEKFAGGTGTESDPYQISNGAELAYLAQQVNGGTTYAGSFFTLTADIQLNEQDVPTANENPNSWTPIGNNKEKFQGTFDGDGHTISGLYISSTEQYQGLFGGVAATCIVKDLIVKGYVASAKENGTLNLNVGGIVVSKKKGAIVQNCGFYGIVVGNTNTTGGVAGGMQGAAQNCWYYYAGTDADNHKIGVATKNTDCYTNAKGANKKGTIVTVDQFKGTGEDESLVSLLNKKTAGLKSWEQGENYPVFATGSMEQKDKTIRLIPLFPDCNFTVSVDGAVYDESTKVYTVSEDITAVKLTRSDGETELWVTVNENGKNGAPVPAEGYPLTSQQTTLHYGTKDDFDVMTAWNKAAVSNSTANISDAAGIKALARMVNSGKDDMAGKTIYLQRDITLAEDWTPIGTAANPFKGSFNGAYFTVSGLKVDSAYPDAGLFGVVEMGDGKIQMLTVSGNVSSTTESASVGGTVGHLLSGTVENCMSLVDVSGNDSGTVIGGVVGRSDGIVQKCASGVSEDVPVVGSGTATNCFYLADTSTFGTDNSANGARTAEEFAAGRVTWELNGGKTSLKKAVTWGMKDTMPAPVGSSKIGPNTINGRVYELTLTKVYAPEGKDVALTGSTGVTVFHNGDTWYAYCIGNSKETFNITVDSTGVGEGNTVTYGTNDKPEKIKFITDSYLGDSHDATANTYYYTIGRAIEADTSWYTGDGPYKLSDAADLFGFAKLINEGNDFSGKTVELTKDIDLSGYVWTPIGNRDARHFDGTFNGNNHRIMNMAVNIAGYDYAGLFGIVNGGIVQNVRVEGSVTAQNAGYVGGIVGYIDGSVKNCLSEVTVTSTGRAAAVGGVVGKAKTIDLCSNMSVVEAQYGYVGGVVGQLTDDGIAQNCANLGEVKGEGLALGGIAGSGAVANSYNHGDVTAVNANGISGNGTVTNSYYVCMLNGADKMFYVNNAPEAEVKYNGADKTYTVGDDAALLVDKLNKNRSSCTPWFVNQDEGVYLPIHVLDWTGKQDDRFTDKIITITYYPNGGVNKDGVDDPISVTVTLTPDTDTGGFKAESYTILAAGSEALGFKHENGTINETQWNTSATGNGTPYAAGSTIQVSEDITLYAQWDNIWAGDGTETCPYEISIGEELAALATQVNDNGLTYAGKWFRLMNSIRTPDDWTPIGNKDRYFCGSLDGKGNTITASINIPNSTYVGVFGYVYRGVFRNLTLNGSISTDRGMYCGSLIGYGKGVTLDHVTGADVDVHGGDFTGGLVGYDTVITAKSCNVSGRVTGDDVVGGIVAGEPIGDYRGTFTDCHNHATVTTSGDSAAGIQAGGGIGSGTFSGCTNSGMITANGTRGQAAGIANRAHTIEMCQNSGAVSAGGSASGIGNGAFIKHCGNTASVTSNNSVASGIAIDSGMSVSFSSNAGVVRGTRAYGISALVSGSGAINNCFSYVAGKDIPLAPNILADGKVTNSYYLASSATAVSSAGEWASADDFASGKVAWGVGGKGEGSQGGTGQDAKLGWWKQDKNDAYPTLLDNPDMSKRYYRTDVDCGTGGEVELARNASSTVKELSSKEAVYGPAGTSVTIKATPKDNTFGLKSLTWTHNGQTDVLPAKGTTNIVMPAESNGTIHAEFASVGPGGNGGYYYGGSGDGTGTGDKDDEGLQDGLNMDVEYDIKGLVLGAYAEWGSNGGNKSFQKWLEENPNVVRALLTNSLDNMATAAVGKKTDEAKDLAALLLASLNEHTGVDGKNGDTIAKALQKYIDSGSEEVFSAWLTGGGGMASGTYESIYGQYASSLAALADRLYSKWEASGTSMTFPVWLDSQQVTMESLSENAEEPDTDTDDTQTTEAPEDVPDGQEAEGGISGGGNSVWEVIGTVVRENPILVWSIVAVIAALIIVGAVRRYHKVKRDEHDEK